MCTCNVESHESNLVPACQPCNQSKGARLLTDWRVDRIRHGVAHSLKVAKEYARLVEALTNQQSTGVPVAAQV
jgi:hypothetical protein